MACEAAGASPCPTECIIYRHSGGFSQDGVCDIVAGSRGRLPLRRVWGRFAFFSGGYGIRPYDGGAFLLWLSNFSK